MIHKLGPKQTSAATQTARCMSLSTQPACKQDAVSMHAIAFCQLHHCGDHMSAPCHGQLTSQSAQLCARPASPRPASANQPWHKSSGQGLPTCASRACVVYMLRNLKVGQRVVGVPWPSAEGEGTWQQYINVSIENLVCPAVLCSS